MPAMEGRNDVLGHPRSFDEAAKSLAATITMLGKGESTEDMVEALPWTKSVSFQGGLQRHRLLPSNRRK